MAEEPTLARWVVSAFTVVGWRGARIEITSAISGLSFATGDFDVLRVLHAFAEPRTIEQVIREFPPYAPEQIRACADRLIEAGVLTKASPKEPVLHGHWDWNALAFHRSSRRPEFRQTPGHATPAVTPGRSLNPIPLIRGPFENGRDLANVLDARRSWRTWPAAPIRRETFSQLLWLSARNRAICWEGTQDECVSRPYPSGGAAYSLELYPVLATDAVESITAGLYRYLPELHSLEPVSGEPAQYLPFLEAAGRSAGAGAPPIVIIITSRFARQSEAYGDLAYSLVLKEVGCLFQTLYLVGEYLGLAPCALGGGAPGGLLANLCNTSELAEPVVGEFMLGPR